MNHGIHAHEDKHERDGIAGKVLPIATHRDEHVTQEPDVGGHDRAKHEWYDQVRIGRDARAKDEHEHGLAHEREEHSENERKREDGHRDFEDKPQETTHVACLEVLGETRQERCIDVLRAHLHDEHGRGNRGVDAQEPLPHHVVERLSRNGGDGPAEKGRHDEWQAFHEERSYRHEVESRLKRLMRNL